MTTSDPLFPEALQFAKDEGKVTVITLMKHFHIQYFHATRLLSDVLEYLETMERPRYYTKYIKGIGYVLRMTWTDVQIKRVSNM